MRPKPLRDAERNLETVAASITALSLDREIDEALLSEVIIKGKRDNRFLNALELVNPKGISLVSSIEYPAHQFDNASRPYIPVMLKHPEMKNTVLGHTFRRFYDQELVVPLARNIYDKNGRYLGILSIDLSISYFSNVYARIATGGKALVALISNDGFVVVRSPFEERFLSLDISQSPVLKELISKKKEEGWFEDDKFLGGNTYVSRLYTYRTIQGFGVTAVYARDIDAILIDWRARTFDNIMYAGAFILIHLILTYFLALHIKRLHTSESSLQQHIERLNQSEISLRASETKFISMFQYSPVPLSVMRLRDELIFEVNDSLLNQFGFTHDQFVDQTPLGLGLWQNETEHEPYLALLTSQGYVERLEVANACQRWPYSVLFAVGPPV